MHKEKSLKCHFNKENLHALKSPAFRTWNGTLNGDPKSDREIN